VRLASAIERALAKDPAARFGSMDDLVDELIACRNELPTIDAAQTMILPAAVAEQSRPVVTTRRRRGRAAVPVLVLVLLAGLAAGGYELWSREHKSPSLGGGGSTPAAAAIAHLTAVAAYDPPPGDGVERNDLVRDATDGNPSSFWQTERYTTAAFGNLKRGVGLVLDAGKNVKLGSLTVKTPTPGFSAVIKAGDSSSGPFDAVSSDQNVGGTTTFTLHVQNAHRYYLIWITQLAQFNTGDPSKQFGAQITEVTAG
jgi:hypothetical protein